MEEPKKRKGFYLTLPLIERFEAWAADHGQTYSCVLERAFNHATGYERHSEFESTEGKKA